MSPSFQRTDGPHTDRNDWQNLRNMMPYLWEYRGRVLLALLVLILAKVANVGVPLVLKEIIDSLEQQPENMLVFPLLWLLVYGALKLSSSLFNELRDAIFARVRYRAMRRLSQSVLRHLHQLSLRFHLDRKTGAISRDLTRGTQSISSILNYMIFNILPTAAEFLLIAVILFSHYDLKFALITFLTVGAYVTFTLSITNWRMHFRHQMNALESEANNQAVDSLINYETVKYFGNEQFEIKRYDKTLDAWEEAAIKSQVSMSALNFGQGAITAIGITLIMWFAVQGVVDGSMTLGDLVLVNAFLLQLFIPLNFLGVVYRAIKYALADMDLLFKVLDEQPEIQDKADAKTLPKKNQNQQSSVVFSQVSFAYQPQRPILYDINFTIKSGEKVAVVGPSGAGKSTLARLLYRFYDVTDGTIAVNGQDIRSITQHSLREAIGIVPQDAVLFNDTLFYNIAYAMPGSDEAAVKQAATLANLDGFIQKLPEGYQTRVGERGLKLSGGEKQRVAIARAIFKNPQILIFDEATSSLDSQSEQMIQEALQNLAKNHATLVIAHRLSTIVDADQILVMDAGRIIERGKHHELLQQQGLYAHMWTLQQEEQWLEKEHAQTQ
ncbi:ABCB family ABC transporter ATP-binding protein/permease [Candidatus Venteria ishoeyi]|uniref:Putative multidrug export ATP-binding/permease protein n=1 Tax=Candidatus Venteria ishoeyi TaxID=1899563 RepID=A0A1H6F5I0_9GAMM|nr:ABC transporter ATP-binding protein/permease [Candidatus Venteria ishoeyi]SEH04539.1 Putative multidrug export ATP-binding/permease protein [Candidatus Venteria ishoeyi]